MPQGQQNQQMGQNGQGNQFADQDILQVCLNETKHMAESLNTFILESGSDGLRQDYMKVLGDLYCQQKQLFDVMQQKGYYSIKNAAPQDISQASAKFSQ